MPRKTETTAAASGAAAREELLKDLQRILSDAEELIGATAKETGSAVEEIRTRIRENLHSARARIADVEDGARATVQRAATGTEEYVRGNPWSAVSIAAGIGILVGLLLNRR